MSSSPKDRAVVLRGYASELLLGVLVIVFLRAAGWLVLVEEFLEKGASAWATFFGLLLAGAMAARVALFNIGSSEFGAWLEWKKLGGVFSAALWSYVSLFLVATAMCIALIFVKGTWLTVAGTFFGILSMIGFFTSSYLVHRLIRLQSIFNLEHKRALEAEKQQPKSP